MKERAYGLSKCKVSTSLGEHKNKMQEHNDTAVGVEVNILARKSDIAARKTLEALWIAFKNPAMNGKEEHVAVIQEMVPFVDLCRLHTGGRQPEGR